MAKDESLQACILEYCSGEFKTITLLINEAAPKSTLYRCKDELLKGGLLESDGKDRYRTTPEGLLKIASLKGESPKGLTVCYPPLAQAPTPQHKAVIELTVAAVIARKFNLRADRHPTIIIAGPTLSWKTSAGIFLCHMHALDPSAQIVNMAAESGRSLWLRKTSTGAIAYKRELLDTPLVVFDEYQSADPESKRLLRIWMDGRKNVAIDNEKLTIEAVPLLTLNPTKGESLEERLGVSRAQLRRSITCDLTVIKLPNLAMKGEDIIAAARNQQPLTIIKPQHDLTKYRSKLYDLFTATLNSEGQELADLETLTMLSTAMTAYFDPNEAIRLVFFDALLLYESLGWTNPGWALHVKNFPTGTETLLTARSSDPKSIPEETLAEAFKFLNEGGAPTELVIRYHLSPDSALLIAKKHNELKATSERKSSQESPAEDPEVVQLKREVKIAELKRQKAEQEKPFEIDKRLGDLQATMAELQTTISHQGSWKKEHCIHFQDNYCRGWVWNARPAVSYQIGEPLQIDGKWYINPNFLRCATCSSYHERGALSMDDIHRTTQDSGQWKQQNCNNYDHNYCMGWQFEQRPNVPYQIGDPLLHTDGKWHIHPTFDRCATCPIFHKRGTRTQDDLSTSLTKLEQGHSNLKEDVDDEDWGLRSRVSKTEDQLNILTANGKWKRDHCKYYEGDACHCWHWENQVSDWKMKKDADKWRLRVSEHPDYCATCHHYVKKD